MIKKSGNTLQEPEINVMSSNRFRFQVSPKICTQIQNTDKYLVFPHNANIYKYSILSVDQIARNIIIDIIAWHNILTLQRWWIMEFLPSSNI